MELRVLNYFMMAAREQNITKAAHLLHVTQPTLSRQLMQLEEELGVVLFKRSSHNIILTEDGALLLRRAQEILSLTDKTIDEFKHSKDRLTGEISIGCGEMRSMTELSHLIRKFREKYPLVRFDIHSSNTISIKQRIEGGLLDMGLFLEPVTIPNYDFIRLPQKEEWGVLVRKDSGLASYTTIKPSDLIAAPLIVAKSSMIQSELANWFGDWAKQMNIVSTYNLIYNSTEMVREGVGAALCLRLNCTYDDLCFVPLEPHLTLTSILAWKDHQPFSSATMAFINFIKDYTSTLSDQD